MKKRTAFAVLTLTALLTALTGLTACKQDTSPSLPENNDSISTVVPDLDEGAGESSSNAPPSNETPIPQFEQYIRCTGDSVRLRSGAGTTYSVLGVAEKGTSYVLLEKTNGWYKTYYRGDVAYISASYASVFSIEKGDEKTENTLNEGYKRIGVPYVYGAIRLHDGKGNFLKGFSAQKFDCSSLVQYVFYHGAGKLLDVTTRTQVKQGEYVPKNQLQRGDCIYFTNAERQHKTGVERIGHVAVYLGDNYILHTASDYARIEKMTAQRWAYYVEARRFLS